MLSFFQIINKAVIFSFCTLCSLLLYSCGKEPVAAERPTFGTIALKTQISRSLMKQAEVHATEFDSMIIEIDASDFAVPVRKSICLNRSSIASIDTISSIPSGPSRVVKVYTVNASGTIVHRDSILSHTIDIEPGACTSVSVNLIPVAGSIYLQLGSLPTSIDSIEAVFLSDSGKTWKAKVKRSSRVYISIDNIDHLTSGALTVTTFSSTGIQLQQATTRLTVNAIKCETVTLSFTSSGGSLSMVAKVQLPAATVVSATFGSGEVATTENGQCIISEIMYAANDSEYVEIYNTTASALHYDTLTLEIDGTRRHFLDVTIVSHDHFVFGRKDLPWADRFHTVQSALDLSPNGNWITLRSGSSILDQVIFSSGSDNLDWPDINGKIAVELDRAHYSATDNNFGRFWVAAKDAIPLFGQLLGTPGN
jgi:hypothetical protein